MIDLTGRTVLITGAAGGIGSATARTIHRGGGTVVVHDVTDASLAPLASELGERCHRLPADLRDRVATQRLWTDALAITGRIDVLVNNAGIYPPAPLDLPLEEWTAVWDLSLGVNLIAPAILCREAIRTYADQDGGGVIVNLASRAAFRG